MAATAIKRATSTLPRTGRSSVGRAHAALVGLMTDGTLGPGTLLPSERLLAERLGLGRGTLREALKRIEQEGLVIREGTRLVAAGAARGDQPFFAKSIAVLLPTVSGDDAGTRSWTRYVTLGATEAVREAGYHALTLNGDLLAESQIRPLVQSRPLGLMLPEQTSACRVVAAAVDAFADAGIPVVAYGNDDALARADRVISDHETGCFELTRWLLRRAKRPVPLWSMPGDSWWLAARSTGYRRAMRAAGLTPAKGIALPAVGACDSRERFEFVSRQLVGFLADALRAQRADAVLCTSDRDSIYVAHALRLLGRRPGVDVLVAGYDAYWQRCEERAFTRDRPDVTVDKHNERVGREMLELLLARIDGGRRKGPTVRRLVPELVETLESSAKR